MNKVSLYKYQEWGVEMLINKGRHCVGSIAYYCKGDSCGFNYHEGNEILNIFISSPPPNALRIWCKVGRGNVLTIGFQVPFAYPVMCGISVKLKIRIRVLNKMSV